MSDLNLPITISLLKRDVQPPQMCDACKRGEHWLCGMQTWCTCECPGPDGDYFEPDPYGAYDPTPGQPHSAECLCESCLQNHPERDILYGNGNHFDWGFDE